MEAGQQNTKNILQMNQSLQPVSKENFK